jgi:hypothetical protein
MITLDGTGELCGQVSRLASWHQLPWQYARKAWIPIYAGLTRWCREKIDLNTSRNRIPNRVFAGRTFPPSNELSTLMDAPVSLAKTLQTG